ncbi:hypothetical protein GIB67_033466 [Kingdonia uniflora]|uniref:Uncharacterized protein n=1 Tax=Kingdonia uniflora TaxID=39325 RepID=A0A7J7MDD8_9MAGN|nr:hypothetical protein GIB67_033466 [Kingdonia uniflora]
MVSPVVIVWALSLIRIVGDILMPQLHAMAFRDAVMELFCVAYVFPTKLPPDCETSRIVDIVIQATGYQSFLIVSDPSIAKHIFRENSKAYSKGILAEILEFVMGKGLIPADGEIWQVRQRPNVPALHKKTLYHAVFILCQNLILRTWKKL